MLFRIQYYQESYTVLFNQHYLTMQNHRREFKSQV